MAQDHPQHIGPYRILDTLGEGGMGTVYLAEQKEPVRRRAALKLIKLGMDSKAVLTRFQAERRALAMMEHTCIATVYDAGLTDHGQPWFAMEYVKGVSITDYCDQNRLDLRARIELFQKVCSGVQHAHMKGVMHRDLKPGNVLVSVKDGKPAPKIIDFGLAKAMDHHLVEATLYTEQGQVVGTPEYMSPEQAGLGGVGGSDVDTRTDVYSLGVLLYELLVGELPFSRQGLRAAGQFEMQRLIREQEPDKPSTRITTLGALATEHAAARRLNVGELHRRLAGDLDWIVLRTLEKDRTRRYETPLELAADLSRHLEHIPVLASPPSLGYRVSKFLRRHRVQCAAAAAVLLAILAGGIGSTLFWLEARAQALLKEEQRAEAQKNLDDANTQRERADSNAVELERKGRESNRLAAVVRHKHVLRAEQELYPAWPRSITAMERWLRDADELLAQRPDIEEAVADLRVSALPASPRELERDRRTHPRRAEWQALQRRVASMQRARDVRSGSLSPVEPTLPADLRDRTSEELNKIAWPLVNWEEPDRPWGQEPRALACAQAAFQQAENAAFADTLAWALFFSGRDEDALEASHRAVTLATDNERAAMNDSLQKLREHIAAVKSPAGKMLLERLEQRLATLTDLVESQWNFEFKSQRFEHDALADLPQQLLDLESNQRASVERRLEWARSIGKLTREHPRSRHTWRKVRSAIQRADDVGASRLYTGQAIELRDGDVMGLVPIGMNPITKLWEFYDLRSAWDGDSDPAGIAIPAHQPDGSIEVTAETGIVFVLLPAGTVQMGAQSKDPNGPNYDLSARSDETLRRVFLAPFFLARHEMTRGQWRRMTDTSPFRTSTGTSYNDDPPIGDSHPADSIDWTSGDRWLRWHGLVLPTEAQWEYGCRALTSTPWWTGLAPADLQGAANVHDQTSAGQGKQWSDPTPIEDGFTAIAPTGTFRANKFGLHDVHGNLWEWCQDEHGDYPGPAHAGDGLRLQLNRSSRRVMRGGSYQHDATRARSAARSGNSVSLGAVVIGLRAARALRP